MVKAIWNNAVIAEAAQTEIVEGNHYFPADSLHKEYFLIAQPTPFAIGRARRATTRSSLTARKTRTPLGTIRLPKRRLQRSPAGWRSGRVSKLRPEGLRT